MQARSTAAALLALQLVGVLGLAVGGTGRPLWIWLADDAQETELRLAHWSERANRVHRRDLHFSADLARVISRQLAHQERVTIASVQAGMVMYYTALRFGSAIEFYDLKGLTTRHFMFLREAEGVGGNSWGLDLDLERYFALAKGRPEPAFHAELIFDIRPLGDLAARNGYAPVLEQVHEGAGLEIALGPLRLGGPALYYEWAAVRSDQLR